MKLGKAVQINIGVSDLETSLSFYETLGFLKIDGDAEPYPWARITDGQNLVLLNQDGSIYIGLVYFSKNAARRVAKLEEKGVEIVQRREHEGQLSIAIFVGPGGIVVGLISHDPASIPQLMGTPKSKCGTFGEFAITVDNLQSAAQFWRELGFISLHESDDPYPWAIMSDEMMILGLHQTGHNDTQFDFSGPAITYFAKDMVERIAGLKSEGVNFTNEMADENGQVRNATLHGPDGELLFMFEGEI